MPAVTEAPTRKPKSKPLVKHKRSSAEYIKSCKLGNETIHKPLTKGGKRQLAVSVRDPELELIVKLCARHPPGATRAGKSLAGKPLPALLQSRKWLRLRDAYAAKNYSLVYRAAERQWRANQHLPGEEVRCLFCPGKPTCDPDEHEWKDGRCQECLTGCNRCLNTGWYLCQPDLEALAYAGLLEAIRLCDFSKGGDKISTYAVWLMKQAMMPLLRQTPVFFPQDLLRDRRVLGALRKSLPCRSCGGEKAKKKCRTCGGTGTRTYTATEADAELLKVRKCRIGETFEERRLLAEGCYYGQEKFSVEELQEAFDSDDTHTRGGNVSVAREALTAPPMAAPEMENLELKAAIARLPTADRKSAEQWLKNRLDAIPPRLVELLRAEML